MDLILLVKPSVFDISAYTNNRGRRLLLFQLTEQANYLLWNYEIWAHFWTQTWTRAFWRVQKTWWTRPGDCGSDLMATRTASSETGRFGPGPGPNVPLLTLVDGGFC